MLRTYIQLCIVACLLAGLLVACDQVKDSPKEAFNLEDNDVKKNIASKVLLEEPNEERNEEPKDQAVDVMKLQKSTVNVSYYSKDINVDMLLIYADTLEQKYDYFKQKYRIDSMHKLTVKLFPNFEEMEPELNYPVDVTISGVAQDDEILIQALNPESPKDLIIHEFTHFVLDEINSPIPQWLNEGLATYEGAQTLNEGGRKYVYDDKIEYYLFSGNPIPTLDQLDTNIYLDYLALLGYEFSYSFVGYIIETYGEDAMMDIATRGANWKKVLGVDESTLEEQWHSYLNEKYKK